MWVFIILLIVGAVFVLKKYKDNDNDYTIVPDEDEGYAKRNIANLQTSPEVVCDRTPADNFRINKFSLGVAGCVYNNSDGTSRQKFVKKLHEGERLKLIPSPMEGYPNAVKVCNMTLEQIGYIPEHTAYEISDHIRRGNKIEAFVKEVSVPDEEFRFWGCLINVVKYTPFTPVVRKGPEEALTITENESKVVNFITDVLNCDKDDMHIEKTKSIIYVCYKERGYWFAKFWWGPKSKHITFNYTTRKSERIDLKEVGDLGAYTNEVLKSFKSVVGWYESNKSLGYL